MNAPTRAFLRRPSNTYPARYAPHGVWIDPALAALQHAQYADALVAAGLSIERLVPDERFPDGVFIEDTAVVWGGRALVCRMAPHREGEQAGVIEALRPAHTIETLPPGATLEGGDVLHTERITYVGRSTRTNAAGAAALRDFLGAFGREVVEIPVERCLHLKSGATWLGDGTLLAAPEWINIHAFEADRVLPTAAGEPKAANAIRIGGHLLTLAGYPGTAAALGNFAGQHGVVVHTLDMTEFEKGDGSLTCLSIIW
jgi:dimethylargininase